jgi:hypothetical protein
VKEYPAAAWHQWSRIPTRRIDTQPGTKTTQGVEPGIIIQSSGGFQRMCRKRADGLWDTTPWVDYEGNLA